MKILHVTYGFQLGGIETMLRNIANEQAGLGHDVSILVINNAVNDELREKLDKKIRFTCLKRKVGSKSIISVFKFNKIIRRINPDIIHLHYASIIRFLVDPFGKFNLCATQHEMCPKQDYKYLRKVKYLYAISDVVKADIKKRTGLESETVYNGINPEYIKTKDASVKPGENINIVQVSRLMHEIKGQHILIRAIEKLVHEKGCRNIKLYLIGDGYSRKYLENMVKEKKLTQNIHFVGAKNQSYVFEHLCEYDLFVQPSINEGFGLTVAEAMAAKVPVIVSDIDGPMEVIGYGQYGCYFKSGDADDCAEKIELFLNGNYEPEKIESAYRKVRQCYDVKITSAKYIEKYRTIINNASSRS